MFQRKNSGRKTMLKSYHGLLLLLPTSCSLRYSYEFVLVIVFCGLLVCKGQGSYDGAGCGFPGEPLEGSVTPNRSNYDTRDTVTYACLADYTLVGPHQITCRQDNTWSSDAPICLKEAAEFERSTVADGNVNTCGDVTNSRSLTLKTLPFSLHSISAVIFSFSKVSGTPIVSVHVSNRGENPQLCRTIANIPRLDSNVYHRYDCDKSLSGNTVTISTRSAAAFSPAVSVTICEIGITSDINGNGQSKCGRPPIPFHGRIKHMTEDRVIYECDKGFFVRPSATSNCEDRVWKNHVQCIRMNLTCGNPGCPANGYYENVDSVRETVSYACLPGHFLVGPSVRTCLSNGTWSNWNQMPKCVPNVAYDKYIVHSDGSEGKNKPSVDGNVETCDVIGYRRDDTKQQRWWRLEFKTLQRISSIQIVQPKGQQKRLKVSTLYSSASSMINIPCNQEPDQSLRCESRQPFNVVAIYVQPEEIRTNFTLCEVIVTDLIGTIPCGTIDEPLNGKVVYEREKPRIVCESGYKMIGASDVTSCIGGQYRWSSPVRCIPMGPETTRPNVKPNYSTTYRPHHTKGTPESISTQEHAEVEKDTMLIGVIGIAVGVTAASISILISIVVIVCIMKRHYKKKHECSHANCSRQNSHHTHSYGGGSGGGGSRTGRDWDESSIHLYETVKPEYDTLEDPYAQTLVVNDSYILTTPKNTMNWTRPRLAPPRNNHIYDVVSTDDALARNDLLNGQTNQRVETIPRTSL